MIIPLELPGVHYLCMTCSGDIVPDDGPVEAASTPLTPIVQEDIQSRTDPEPNGSLP